MDDINTNEKEEITFKVFRKRLLAAGAGLNTSRFAIVTGRYTTGLDWSGSSKGLQIEGLWSLMHGESVCRHSPTVVFSLKDLEEGFSGFPRSGSWFDYQRDFEKKNS